ncbi:uncharacterized protein [Littorina saxatilis]|uniref:uncharacterized protein n=1 Tax=Littorina saxatilis TaxID=31220 RepID=UPI0038B595DE
MKIQAVRTLLLVTIFVIVIMCIYFALIPESYYLSRHFKPKNLTQGFPVVKDASFSLSRWGAALTNSSSVSRKVSSDMKTSIQIARDIYHTHGVVLFTMVNDAFFPFAASWCCNTAPMNNVHHRALFLTTDQMTGQRLSHLWPNITVVTLNSSQYAGSQEYSKAGYVRMMVERTRYILHLLEAGVRLLLFEVDCVWLSDPVPALLARHAEGDILATKVTDLDVTAGGFLLLNPTKATVKLWRHLTDKMDSLYRRLQNSQDAADVSEADNDQQYFTLLVRKKFAGVRVVHLPAELFPDGKWYKLPASERSSKPRPFLINNNWVVGEAAKMRRAKRFGHWFWNDEGKGSCNSTAVDSLFY